LYVFGNNGNGQLGIGNTAQQPTPQLNPLTQVLKFLSGNQATFVIQSDFFCFGKNKLNSEICSGRGICIANNTCSCPEEYMGNECQLNNCFGKNSSNPTVCSGNGNCSQPNVCTCSVGYDGKECETKTTNTKYYRAYTFGYNNRGQLGDGTLTNRNSPIEIGSSLNYIEKAFVGYDFQFVMTNYSKVYSVGKNNYGQLLIDGNQTDKYRLEEIFKQNYDILDISAGNDTTLVLTKDRIVFSVGRNDYGQLGLGHKVNMNSLTRLIYNFDNVDKVSIYALHALILRNGSVFSFGQGSNGKLGLGDSVERTIATKIEGFDNIIDISTGVDFSMILNRLGKVYCFGSNVNLFHLSRMGN
jgi:alpha-tubulin suppressor-like RCC1 family protein